MPPPYGPRGFSLVRKYVRKRTFGTSARVLIHLSSESLRPEEQTQEGIAAATRSGRSTLTKWLDRLERRGLVTRDRVRVVGHPLPKNAYALSGAGWQAANELRKRLASQVVTVRAPNLPPLSVRVAEVPSLAPAQLDLTGALSSTRMGRLDLTRAPAVARNRGPVVWGNGLRRVDRFFGRTEELKTLDAWWASDLPVLFVTGLPGIGKSALVAAWIQGRPLRVPVFGYEAHRSSTAAGVLADFGAFLAALGKPGLAAHLAQGVPLDLAFVARLIERDLADVRIIVAFDNCDQGSRDVARLFGELFIGRARRLSARIILLGRRFPRWLGRLDRRGISFESLTVQGLDEEAAMALLRSRGLGPGSAFLSEIARKTRGHPLLLHLAAATGTGKSSAVHRYLEDELWTSLSSEDRAVLEAASVLRKAVSEHVLAAVADTERPTLERLAERNLLERTVAGGYLMHDLVRELVAGKVSERRRKRLHSAAAGPLLEATSPREKLEGVYHLLEAGRPSEAARFLDRERSPLLDCVGAEELASLVGQVTLEETDADAYSIFAELLGDSLRVRGHLGPALFQYEHASRRAAASGRPERLPRLLRKMAFIERCRNRYSKALGYLVEAHGRMTQSRDVVEKAEILREMALVEQSLGDLAQAAGYLNEAVDSATEGGDWAGLSRALLALSSLETSQGNREHGLAHSLEGLRLAERTGSLTETAHAHIVVGTALAELHRLKESLTHFETGLELSRGVGNLRLTAYATMNRTAILMDLGRYDLAAGSLAESRSYFEILEERDTLALLKVYEGQLEMGLNRWSRAVRAWGEGISALRKEGAPVDLARALKEVGLFEIQHGMVDEGRAYLREAREIAGKIGNATLVSEIEGDLPDQDATVRVRPSD